MHCSTILMPAPPPQLDLCNFDSLLRVGRQEKPPLLSLGHSNQMCCELLGIVQRRGWEHSCELLFRQQGCICLGCTVPKCPRSAVRAVHKKTLRFAMLHTTVCISVHFTAPPFIDTHILCFGTHKDFED